MDKDQLLTIFNKQFKEFVEDISRVFPLNSDISAFKPIIGQLLTITPKTIYKTFKKHVADKYQAEIEAGDINFFIDKDYNGDLANTDNNAILEKIDCLRAPVREMNPSEQAKVIKYLQNMAKLCQLYEEAA
jgi:hypothetical protein